jgi:replicative DNA helicase
MAVTQAFTKTNLRVPPSDNDAEQALLGSIMLNPKGLLEIMDFLSERDFYTGRNQKIFKAMFRLNEKGQPVDLVSISSFLKENNLLEQAGGPSYLAELTSKVPSASNLKYYAELVRKKSALRSLIESAELISDLGY